MNVDDAANEAYEHLARRAYVERAATLLKSTRLVGSLSRRLLIDYVERSDLYFRKPGDSAVVERDELDPFLAVVVLEGMVSTTARNNETIELSPGAHLRRDLAHRIALGHLQLTASAASGSVAVFLLPRASDLADSPTAAWSLNPADFPVAPPTKPDKKLSAIERARRVELIGVCASPETNVPVEAAMHILGAAAAREVPEAEVTLLIDGESKRWLRWDRTAAHFVVINPPPPPTIPGRRALIFYGRVTGPLIPFPDWESFPGFDRIVHVTTQPPDVLPADLGALLRPGLLRRDVGESVFSSYIASVLIDYDPSASLGGGLFCKGEFKMQYPGGDAAARPYRDGCCLRVDPTRLRDEWENWIPNGADQCPPFVDVAARERAMRAETSERWGRTVTNRRVGFALSGGGASAYRAGPLLERINDADIPIDVFTALSGGALVGAFCCAHPCGFEAVKDLGPFFQLTLPGALYWTWPYVAVVDACLGGRRVEELEQRFAAVAVELPETQVPRVGVVVKGTLGEAVRVSGALPPSFAPATKNWLRYTDGGAGTAVPAQVARDCGADVVLACNAIPGPARGNPYSALPDPSWLLRWTPFVGRLIDSYTWFAFSSYRLGRQFGLDGDAFVDFNPQPFPLIESTAFIAARCIVEEAEKEGPMLSENVEKLRRAWLAAGKPPLPAPEPPPKRRRGGRK
jgi:predicted acylesterase/phospholipase RssA